MICPDTVTPWDIGWKPDPRGGHGGGMAWPMRAEDYVEWGIRSPGKKQDPQIFSAGLVFPNSGDTRTIIATN